MANTIAILDDEPDRIEAMVRALSNRLPELESATFDNAPEMIDWCREHLAGCVLLSLDHDLGPNRIRGSKTFDPGTGRDVVDYLATRRPVCPVIVHTTNSLAAPGMEMALEDSGWRCVRVVPNENLSWIRQWWIEVVTGLLQTR